MKTEKLYMEDVYAKKCSAKILKIDGTSLVLDKTIFFPTGGGQPCDLGTIDEAKVLDVKENGDEIYHELESSSQSFKEGQIVTLSLDWNRRFFNMQRHCGEHILSGIFFRQLGAINQGFHMGDDYMTIDMDLPQITWEQAMAAELSANEVIWENAATTTRTFENRGEAEALPLRKPLAIDENITIVCVGDVANPADCVACCGTHPSSAGQVGLIKILKLESNKGMTRIYFKAGREAYFDFAEKHDILTALSKKYSATTNDLLDKIKTQEDKNNLIRKKLYNAKKVLLSKATDEILENYTNEELSKFQNKMPLVRIDYDYFDLEDLQVLGKNAASNIKGLLLLVSQNDRTIMLFSNGTPDCGKLVRENAEIYQGKGGGNNISARAIFTKSDYVDTFIDLIEKHLR